MYKWAETNFYVQRWHFAESMWKTYMAELFDFPPPLLCAWLWQYCCSCTGGHSVSCLPRHWSCCVVMCCSEPTGLWIICNYFFLYIYWLFTYLSTVWFVNESVHSMPAASCLWESLPFCFVHFSYLQVMSLNKWVKYCRPCIFLVCI